MNDTLELVCPDDYGIESRHYYFLNHDRFFLTLEELAAVGVTDDKCRVGKKIIKQLQAARDQFEACGYKLIIKDGYRSPELYRLVYDRRVEKFGQEHTDSLMSIERMIHARGNVVDIDLIRLDGGQIRFRAGEDGVPAHYYGFYKNRHDADAIEYQSNQDLMKDVMFGLGFVFGTLVEYWHFELPSAA